MSRHSAGLISWPRTSSRLSAERCMLSAFLMNVDSIRRYCMSFPHATEQVQWEHHLLFKIGGKMFVIADLDPPHHIVFKCSPEQFAELTEREGISPAPYLARAKWVSVEHHDALEAGELKELIRNSYDMVKAKLPRNVLAKLK